MEENVRLGTKNAMLNKGQPPFTHEDIMKTGILLRKYTPKDFYARPKASDAHQKVSDAHQKAADGTHKDEESATRLQKMAFKEEMPKTLHPSLFECKLFSISVLYG